MDASIKFCAHYNEHLGDYVSPPATSDNYSVGPWADLSIAITDTKFGAGCLQYRVNDIPENSIPEDYYAGLSYTLGSEVNTDEFTIHCWIKFPQCPGVFWQINDFMRFTSMATWDMYPSNADPQGPYNFVLYDAKIEFTANRYQNGEDTYIYTVPLTNNTSVQPTNWLYDVNAWHHIAFTMSGGNAYAFIDGVLKSTIAVTGSNIIAGIDSWFNLRNWNDWWYFGGWYVHVYTYAPEKAIGLIDEHIISSVPLWTEAFTPPEYELTSALSVSSAVKLLLHMNDADNFVDSGTELHDVINVDDKVIHSTETFRLGDASGLFDNAVLSTVDADWWPIFRNDWTIDFWVNIPDLGSTEFVLFSQYKDGYNYMHCKYKPYSKILELELTVGGKQLINIRARMELLANIWHHIALTASSFLPVEVS